MKLVIDQDQVICQWLERVLQWYNEDRGTSYTREDIVNWDVTSCLPNSHDFLRAVMRYPELYRDLEPVEGAINGMKTLIEAGHDVVIATYVPFCAGIAFHGKLEWIRRNMPFFDLENFIAIKRKQKLAPASDLLLDDGMHNIIPWIKTGKKAAIFDCPWNRNPVVSTGDDGAVYRVRHWNEFLQLVEKLSIETPSKEDDHGKTP